MLQNLFCFELDEKRYRYKQLPQGWASSATAFHSGIKALLSRQAPVLLQESHIIQLDNEMRFRIFRCMRKSCSNSKYLKAGIRTFGLFARQRGSDSSNGTMNTYPVVHTTCRHSVKDFQGFIHLLRHHSCTPQMEPVLQNLWTIFMLMQAIRYFIQCDIHQSQPMAWSFIRHPEKTVPFTPSGLPSTMHAGNTTNGHTVRRV